MSHNDLLVLGVACMVTEVGAGKATNKSFQLVGARYGQRGQGRGKKSNQ